jgi:hypothetical protein
MDEEIHFTNLEDDQFDAKCQEGETSKKRRIRRCDSSKKKSNFERDDASVDGDPLSKLVQILGEDIKKPQQDTTVELLKFQTQQKVEEEKTKQLELNLKLKLAEIELLKMQQTK